MKKKPKKIYVGSIYIDEKDFLYFQIYPGFEYSYTIKILGSDFINLYLKKGVTQ